VQLKTSRRLDFKKTFAVMVGLTVALVATWFWSGYFEVSQDQREKRPAGEARARNRGVRARRRRRPERM
jgi:hypothetical protein